MSKVLEVKKNHRHQESFCRRAWKRVGEKEAARKKGVKEGVQGKKRRKMEREGERWRSLPKDILVKNPYFAFLTFSAMNNSFL